ncbi:MAG: cardiolipin synthase [Thiothrix sp.]|nr:MAG: cardiolipin synthase [Thiothrix sp.]
MSADERDLFLALLFAAELLTSIRVLLRPHRQPATRIAWLVIIHMLPLVGMLSYLLFGEVYLGHRLSRQLRRTKKRLPTRAEWQLDLALPEAYLPLFKLAYSISGFLPVSGNSASLPADSNAVIDQLVTDINQAQNHVHIVFYIWLPDHNGGKVVEALKSAAQRGVCCRVLVDSMGSRSLIHSEHWPALKTAGVKLAQALPIGKFPPFTGRIDVRNHRKIVVIDQRITYCGSQNCADPEFLPKAAFAPWVDMMLRFEGPIAAQNQYLFASDWMLHVHEDLSALLKQPIATPLDTRVDTQVWAQILGTGPSVRASAVSEMFTLLIHSARRRLFITTPYYVPDESMHNALCTAAYRGVEVKIIFPARNDSWIVSAASRSYYASLLQAGVQIYEYTGGLLHAKTLTFDGQISMIGSANLDRRSFDLNYENNMLIYSEAVTTQISQRQQEYLAGSQAISLQQVRAWRLTRRLWNNSVAILGPLL